MIRSKAMPYTSGMICFKYVWYAPTVLCYAYHIDNVTKLIQNANILYKYLDVSYNLFNVWKMKRIQNLILHIHYTQRERYQSPSRTSSLVKISIKLYNFYEIFLLSYDDSRNLPTPWSLWGNATWCACLNQYNSYKLCIFFYIHS